MSEEEIEMEMEITDDVLACPECGGKHTRWSKAKDYNMAFCAECDHEWQPNEEKS